MDLDHSNPPSPKTDQLQVFCALVETSEKQKIKQTDRQIDAHTRTRYELLNENTRIDAHPSSTAQIHHAHIRRTQSLVQRFDFETSEDAKAGIPLYIERILSLFHNPAININSITLKRLMNNAYTFDTRTRTPVHTSIHTRTYAVYTDTQQIMI